MRDEKNYESLSVVCVHRSPKKCVTKKIMEAFQLSVDTGPLKNA
jgi:hypothetical protein